MGSSSIVAAFLCATALTLAMDVDPSAPRTHVKRSYVCPPKFIRQGHRCYFFSKEPEPFQQAMFSCRNMRSSLAVIKTKHQDKVIRSFLARKTLAPLERWLGGVYDWQKKSWKWAASGKPLTYDGFANGTDGSGHQSWHCIVMDPSLGYKWNSRSCLDAKHFICHTKMKTVTGRGKKKLQRQYHADRNNRLNEVPVPELPEYENSQALKSNVPQNFVLNDQADVGKGRRRKNKRAKARKDKTRFTRFENGTTQVFPRRRTDKAVDFNSIRDIKWRTYRQKNKENPLYPRPIVEEYNFLKD